MKVAPYILLFALAACASAPEREARSTSALFAKDIGVVRAAAMSSLIRMGLSVQSTDASGSEQGVAARGDGTDVHVALEALTPSSTRMTASVLAAPGSDALGRFVDGVESVIAGGAPGWTAPAPR